MKRVLVVGFTDNPGGIENVVMNYYRNFDRNKIQLDFLYSTDTIAFKEEIESLGGKVFRIAAKHNNYLQYKKDLKEFFKLNGKNYSSIWVNFCNITNLDYFKFAKKYGIKKRIIHAHNSQNMGSNLKGILHKLYKIRLSSYATDFWSCSNDASHWFYYKKNIDSDKYVIINNAIDVEKFKYDENIRRKTRKENNWDDKIVVGNVGRLHFQKNQMFALKVFKKFKNMHDNAIFVLVGEGEDKNILIDEAKALGIEKSVFFYGLRNDVPNLLNGMDIALFPSLFEGLSLSLVEAQCAKLLTISSNTVSLDTKMSDYIYFLDLGKTPQEWAAFIEEKYMEFDRKNAINDISKKGYNIKKEVKKIESLLKK